MTLEGLMHQVRQQKAELIAVDLLLDALMRALSPEQQDAWMKEIRSLASMRQEFLLAHGSDEAAIRLGQHAIERRSWRLEEAKTI